MAKPQTNTPAPVAAAAVHAAAPAAGAAPLAIAYGHTGAKAGKPGTVAVQGGTAGTVTLPGGVVLPWQVPASWQCTTLQARAAGALWLGSPNGGAWAAMHVCYSAAGAVVLRLLPGGTVGLHPYALAAAPLTAQAMPGK